MLRCVAGRAMKRERKGYTTMISRQVRSGNRVRLGTLAAWVASITLVAACPAEAGVGDYRCVNPTQVYMGNAKRFQRPCVISADRVYRSISEYREIVDKGLTDKDLRYHLLMKKAARKFADAIKKKMARTHRHDLVAESGAVEPNPKKEGIASVPDRTSEAVAAL